MQDILWLFPVIFMVHEMEEIIGLRIWLEKNIDITKKYSRISKIYQNVTTEAFSVAVLEEYLLSIIITALSIYFKIYLLWIGVIVELHYSTFSVIMASLLCFIVMLINLMFIHKLMKKVSTKFNN